MRKAWYGWPLGPHIIINFFIFGFFFKLCFIMIYSNWALPSFVINFFLSETLNLSISISNWFIEANKSFLK